ncbi:PrsW family glutamic-type intramembrane protease [Kribbella sp. CA-293567]|uniref:PrsW family glutamic-type intramembrane protease n=1 Tax=Kribbella sp. CA-293567 TaxID=3002436 RepID=UPI0022DD4445|nr:PrsW family glutamic-type intramembrane protease [Kribbella sp. CA-293567]WBQ02370.1 PrsW family glutamic-type intramembrane protease [Kribbella sp. CA-293567]
MECPRCSSDVPEVSHFCHRCGSDLQSADAGRKKAYAARPDEPVASFKLVSTIMPQGAGRQPYTYKVALGIALLLTVVTAALGALPVAIMVAAFAIPIVYILYLYDVNLWEDEPVPVVAAAFVLTGVLAAVFTWLWSDRISLTSDLVGSNPGGPSGRDLVILMLLVPVVSELIRQIGPIYLASRPRYDDLMDGFTFGVVAGVGFACFETLVLHWAWISGGFAGPGSSTGTWISIVVLQGFVKPLIYGSATGLAVAEFSGLGEKYDGFTPRWVFGLIQAMAVNAAFQGGVYLLGFIGGRGSTIGAILGVVWGLVLLGALIILVRTVLHKGLLEAALESAARGGSNHASGELAFCSRCEMPLLPHSDFCSACGNSVRSVPKSERGVAARGSVPAAGFDGITGETQA